MKLTVGKFSYDLITSLVTGPADYLDDRDPLEIQRIMSGRSAVVAASVALGHTVEHGILLALQTDYAGWLGMKEFTGTLDR